MESNRIVYRGVGKDETYQAYKDIYNVIGAQSGQLITPVGVMLPRVVVMGEKADDGD